MPGRPTQKDNSTGRLKIRLRQRALRQLADTGAAPVVLETHGGLGRIGDACYRDVAAGLVLEQDPGKALLLARKRPTWAVYEGDCVAALRGGLGAWLPVNFLDVDPYGDPWPVLAAFFGSERPRPATLHVLVNDGLRQKTRLGGAWSCATLQPLVQRHGNGLWECYLECCRELMQETAGQAGYHLTGWAGYYCGRGQSMTHYWATLRRAGRDGE